jgi:hypothetical protein
MRLSICFFILSLQIFGASEASKNWNEWPSNGIALGDHGDFRPAANAFRQALTAAAGLYLDADREWSRAPSLVDKTGLGTVVGVTSLPLGN